ncbi:MAG TPA: fibronectin type III-like domain-contianing protein [Edaphobacter sp.]|nr:fibronectin type III-like domain-contianing protein [Edaphobacter sp.]
MKEWRDSSAYGRYPGENLRVKYDEGIYVGYRYLDKHGIAPLYPFGYGLSYTKFDYTDLSITPRKAQSGQTIDVSAKIHNRGSRAGAEIVEAYIHDGHATVDRPIRELKGFRRVEFRETLLMRHIFVCSALILAGNLCLHDQSVAPAMTATRTAASVRVAAKPEDQTDMMLRNIAHVSLGSTDLVSVEIATDANSMVSLTSIEPQRIPPTRVPSGGSTTVEITFTQMTPAWKLWQIPSI